MKFTGDGENTIQSYVSGGDLQAIVETGTATNTLASLKEAQASAIDMVRTLDATFEAGINIQENRAEIYTLDKALSTALEKDNHILSDKVELVEVSHMARRTTDVFAGLGLTSCTAGFSVEDSNGTKGITTAAHCSNTQSYGNINLPIQSPQAYGGSGEVQWHTTPGLDVVNEVKIGSYSREVTDTTDRSEQSVGEYVCNYGMVTGYDCGHINDTSWMPSDSCDNGGVGCFWNPTFVRVRASNGQVLADNGDSGGPWFIGQSAYGIMVWALPIHQVSSSGPWIRTDAAYMPVDYMSLIGVEILTD